MPETFNEVANQEVQRILDLQPRWRETPNYTNFDETKLRRNIDDVYGALKACWGDLSELTARREISHKSLDRVFHDFHSPELERAEYTFLVPKRIERRDGAASVSGCISELDIHFPIYSQEFGIDENIAQRGIAGLPPMIVSEKNNSPIANQRGVIVCAPLEASMMPDYVNSPNRLVNSMQKARLLRDVHRNINASMRFIQKLQSRVVGLGATLPSPTLTNFGQRIRVNGITTTTGHGGTVHLVSETVSNSARAIGQQDSATLGVIGAAGSIGSSTLAVLRQRMPHLKIVAYDTREKNLHQIVSGRTDSEHITIASSALDVIRNSDIVVSAIVGEIDLDHVDPDRNLNLTGKVLIDDSQPGCFERSQVEARNGKLLWVVGQDNSPTQMATRTNGFNYGSAYGLVDTHHEFGCGLEAASLAATGALDHAIRDRVTPLDADKIGTLFNQVGFGVASPQSYSRPVSL